MSKSNNITYLPTSIYIHYTSTIMLINKKITPSTIPLLKASSCIVVRYLNFTLRIDCIDEFGYCRFSTP